jgi:mRNA interferase HigB
VPARRMGPRVCRPSSAPVGRKTNALYSLLLPWWEHARNHHDLRVFNRSTLVAFWTKHADAENQLRLWFSIVERAAWTGPADVRAAFGTADFVHGDRVVFNIMGNAYRLIVQIKYAPVFLVFIRFVGTHAEYDRIDAAKV